MSAILIRRCVVQGAIVAVLLLAPWGRPSVAAMPSFEAAQSVMPMQADSAIDPGRYFRRLTTHAEHSIVRFATVFRHAGLVWVWILTSAAAFLLTVAVSSTADFRMFDLRRQPPWKTMRDLGLGARLFFRLLVDRRTPYAARSMLAIALAYWLVPSDLIPDLPVLPGLADDLVVAVSAAKAFVYLCPDAVVARHANAVEARTEA